MNSTYQNETDIGQQLIIICNMCKGNKTTFLRTRFIYKHVIYMYYKPGSGITSTHRTAASPRHIDFENQPHVPQTTPKTSKSSRAHAELHPHELCNPGQSSTSSKENIASFRKEYRRNTAMRQGSNYPIGLHIQYVHKW